MAAAGHAVRRPGGEVRSAVAQVGQPRSGVPRACALAAYGLGRRPRLLVGDPDLDGRLPLEVAAVPDTRVVRGGTLVDRELPAHHTSSRHAGHQLPRLFGSCRAGPCWGDTVCTPWGGGPA